jgi:molecular chaperone GrpE
MTGKPQQNTEEMHNEEQDPAVDSGDTQQPSSESNQHSDEQTEQEQPGESLQDQLSAAQDKYLRLMAEFDNYKRRTSREYERLVEAANERLMVEIIDVRENFERALKAGKEKSEFGPFFDGMKLIFSKFEDVLQKAGLEVFAEPGDLFDPEIHDALMKTPHQSIEEGHIADIFEKGYRLKGRVIKHARVIVSDGAAQPGTDADGSNQNSENSQAEKE